METCRFLVNPHSSIYYFFRKKNLAVCLLNIKKLKHLNNIVAKDSENVCEK